MSMSACPRGRPYTLGDALKAAQQLQYKTCREHAATSCALGDHWHVIDKTASQSRPDPFPPAVARQLDERDEVCQRCGKAGRLERHHRRAKHMGGSKGRSHTQCACNGVRLCRACHEWVHKEAKQARALGLIVLQSVSLPSSVGMHPRSFRYATLDDYNDWMERGGQGSDPVYPTCDGEWSDTP